MADHVTWADVRNERERLLQISRDLRAEFDNARVPWWKPWQHHEKRIAIGALGLYERRVERPMPARRQKGA